MNTIEQQNLKMLRDAENEISKLQNALNNMLYMAQVCSEHKDAESQKQIADAVQVLTQSRADYH